MGVSYGTESKRTESRAGRGGVGREHFFLVALYLFHLSFLSHLLLPSLAPGQAYMLLFNREVGSTLFLHDRHEFYEKG